MYSFNTGINRIIDYCVSNAARFQHFHSLICLAPQIFKLPEFDRFRWARLGAGWLQSCALSIRAKGALECAPIGFIFFHHAKRTTHNTVGAAVAYVRLNEDSSKLHPHDCARGACFQTAGHFAMLADVRRETPCRQLLCGVAAAPDPRSILHKLHMPPRRMPYGHGVVIRIAAPLKPIFSKLVPFLACHLAGLAADAQRGIGQKCSCAHAVLRRSRRQIFNACALLGTRPGCALHTSALVSMIRTLGSSEIDNRSFGTSPVTRPL